MKRKLRVDNCINCQLYQTNDKEACLRCIQKLKDAIKFYEKQNVDKDNSPKPPKP